MPSARAVRAAFDSGVGEDPSVLELVVAVDHGDDTFFVAVRDFCLPTDSKPLLQNVETSHFTHFCF